jgi:hypothetical protein
MPEPSPELTDTPSSESDPPPGAMAPDPAVAGSNEPEPHLSSSPAGGAGQRPELSSGGADSGTGGSAFPFEPDAGNAGDGGTPATEPLIDAGEPAAEDAAVDNPEQEGGVEGIIAVGYGGLRIVTRDRGETWEDETHWSEDGGDDFDLLRTIAYGNGLWVSGGWRFVTSSDGVNWDDQGDAEEVIDAVSCPVTDGLAFGNGEFLVACGSELAASSDGLQWESRGPTPDVGGHPYLVFDPARGQFACSGDDGLSYVSLDGEEWTSIGIDTVHLCEGGLTSADDCPSFYYDGVFLSAEWGGQIRRSGTGTNFETRYEDDFGNNVFTEYAFAVGRVAP